MEIRHSIKKNINSLKNVVCLYKEKKTFRVRSGAFYPVISLLFYRKDFVIMGGYRKTCFSAICSPSRKVLCGEEAFDIYLGKFYICCDILLG